MDENLTLIDSDVLVAILRKEKRPTEYAQDYLSRHGRFNISCLTWYECYRGYKVIGATRRLKEFQRLMELTNIIYIDEKLLSEAAEVYASLYRQGKLTGEFDLLIGLTALQNGWKLATNNIKHYQVLVNQYGLLLENWMFDSQ